MDLDGYFIVQTFQRRYADYDRPAPPSQRVYAIPINGEPPSSASKRYRGVDRRPLSAVPRQMRGEFPNNLVEPEAQDRLNRLEERGVAKDDLIRDLVSAQWVMSAVQDQKSYEVIGVRRLREKTEVDTPRLFGWDVAYLDGDHYSAIANCMFFPSWGGTDEAGATYSVPFNRLNEHGLFSSIDDARTFRELYESITAEVDRGLEYLFVAPAA